MGANNESRGKNVCGWKPENSNKGRNNREEAPQGPL